MILTLLGLLLKAYCLVSYVFVAYVLFKNRKHSMELKHHATMGDWWIANTLFWLFSPFIMGYMVYRLLANARVKS